MSRKKLAKRTKKEFKRMVREWLSNCEWSPSTDEIEAIKFLKKECKMLIKLYESEDSYQKAKEKVRQKGEGLTSPFTFFA